MRIGCRQYPRKPQLFANFLRIRIGRTFLHHRAASYVADDIDGDEVQQKRENHLVHAVIGLQVAGNQPPNPTTDGTCKYAYRNVDEWRHLGQQQCGHGRE